jgi:hypothetical protein
MILSDKNIRIKNNLFVDRLQRWFPFAWLNLYVQVVEIEIFITEQNRSTEEKYQQQQQQQRGRKQQQ